MMGIEMGAVVRRFLIVFVQDLRDDRNGLLVIELRVVVERLVRRVVIVGMIVFMMMIMVVMMFVVSIYMVCNRTAAVFTHNFSLFFIYYNAKGAKPLSLR